MSRYDFRHIGMGYMAIFSILLFTACSDRPIYNEAIKLNGQWDATDSIVFHMPAPDTTSVYEIALNITHKDAYPFQNIYIKIYTLFPSGRRTSNLLNIDLGNKSGQWYGTKSRGRYLLSVPIRSNFSFTETGTYELTMVQFTRRDQLAGVDGVELELWNSTGG